ncbi:ceramide synthase 1-like isoform X1 [Arapaima gigas]
MDGHSSQNPEIEPIVSGYSDLVSRGYAVIFRELRDCTDCGLELSRRTLRDNAHISYIEVVLFVLCALLWTTVRRALTDSLFKPAAQWWGLLPRDAAKMPESVWKLIFYSMSWSYSTYLLFFCQYPFFHEPSSTFNGWKSGMEVPTDIAIVYLIQGSFYGHSIYATVYMDAWRKDSIVMIVHHVITLTLITLSYAFRYHNIGVLVLFLHDLSDILLEFTKLNVYFKSRGGSYHLLNDMVSTVGFISFSITWFWFRLYWFPLKVLYASIISSVQTVPGIPFYFFFNSLLFALLLMNIYWFLFIVQTMVKVLMGQMTEVNDLREYEEEEGQISPAQHDETGSWSLEEKGKYARNGIIKEKLT